MSIPGKGVLERTFSEERVCIWWQKKQLMKNQRKFQLRLLPVPGGRVLSQKVESLIPVRLRQVTPRRENPEVDRNQY